MAMPPSKGDLYNDDELFELLTIHQSLTTANDVDSTAKIIDDESIVLGLGGSGVHERVLQCLNEDLGDDVVDSQSTNANGNPTVEISTIPDLHKFVLETIGDSNISSSAAPSSNDKVEVDKDTYSINQLAYENLQILLRDRKPNIRAIATGMSLLSLYSISIIFVFPTSDFMSMPQMSMAHFFRDKICIQLLWMRYYEESNRHIIMTTKTVALLLPRTKFSTFSLPLVNLAGVPCPVSDPSLVRYSTTARGCTSKDCIVLIGRGM